MREKRLALFIAFLLVLAIISGCSAENRQKAAALQKTSEIVPAENSTQPEEPKPIAKIVAFHLARKTSQGLLRINASLFMFDRPYWNEMPILYYVSEEKCVKGEAYQTNCRLLRKQVYSAMDYWNTNLTGYVEFRETNDSEKANFIVYLDTRTNWSSQYITLGKAEPEAYAAEDGTLIRHGTVTFYQLDGCYVPKTMVHEIGHILGLNHTQDRNSIMYWLKVSCFATLSDQQLNDLKSIYQPVVAVKEAQAVQKGDNLSVSFKLQNTGRSAARNVIAAIGYDNAAGKGAVRNVTIGELPAHSEKQLNISYASEDNITRIEIIAAHRVSESEPEVRNAVILERD